MINLRIILFFLGILIVSLGLAMLLPLVIEINSDGVSKNNFLISIFLSLFVGITLILAFRKEEKKMNVKDTILITILSWPAMIVFSSLPFYLDHNTNSYIDSIFEATSGLTTTGATIYKNTELLSSGILIWRALLQWLGGLGIIIFAIAIIPIFNIGGIRLFTQDWSEKPKDLHYRSKEIGKLLGSIYILFTLFIFILLYLSGLNFFDAFCHSLTTIATGGFSTKSSSIGYYNNIFTELTIVMGMLLASLPFTLYISCFRKNFSIFSDSQVLLFFSLIILFVLAIAVWLHIENNINILLALRLSLFNSVSVMTGTGFSTENFSNWGYFSNTVFILMMLIGGCSGSTTGGLKIFRIQVLWAIVIKELKRIKSPRAISSVNFKRINIDDSIINSVMIIFFCFLISIFFISSIFMYYEYDFITSISAAFTSISVVGPGLGNIIGPEGSFAEIPSLLKLLLSAGMILGRLEFLAFLIILVPRFWAK
jgi:trk system potassium uptake protein TrkH